MSMLSAGAKKVTKVYTGAVKSTFGKGIKALAGGKAITAKSIITGSLGRAAAKNVMANPVIGTAVGMVPVLGPIANLAAGNYLSAAMSLIPGAGLLGNVVKTGVGMAASAYDARRASARQTAADLGDTLPLDRTASTMLSYAGTVPGASAAIATASDIAFVQKFRGMGYSDEQIIQAIQIAEAEEGG